MLNVFFVSLISFKFSLVQLAADTENKDAKLADVRRFCPSIQTDFWNCMNKTINGKFVYIKAQSVNVYSVYFHVI